MNAQPPPILPSVPPPVPPKKPYYAWLRVPLSLVGLVIAMAPSGGLLFCIGELPDLWKKAALEIVISVFVATAVGSYLCVRALIRKRWVALLCWFLLTLAFLAIDVAIGLFVGCLYGLRDV